MDPAIKNKGWNKNNDQALIFLIVKCNFNFLNSTLNFWACLAESGCLNFRKYIYNGNGKYDGLSEPDKSLKKIVEDVISHCREEAN